MDWQFTPFAVPLFVGAALMAVVCVIALRRRSAPGSIPLFFVGLAAIAYAMGYAFEVGSTTVDAVRFWLKIEYLGVLFGPGCILIMVLAVTGRQRLMTPINLLLLFAIPVMMTVMVWTNDIHELVWHNIRIDTSGSYTRTFFDRNPWYWVQVPNTYVTLILSLVLLVRSFRTSAGLYRRQVAALLIGLGITALSHVIYLSGLLLPGLDINPYFQLVAEFTLAWSILSFQFLELVPVAREAVVSSMSDAVIVIDSKNRLVDLNPAAQAIAGTALDRVVGQAIESIFPAAARLLQNPVRSDTAQYDLVLQVEGQQRYFDVSSAPLNTRQSQVAGQLLVLRDITDLVEVNQRANALRAMEGMLAQKLDVDFVMSMAADSAMRFGRAEAVCIVLGDAEQFRVAQVAGAYPASLESTLQRTKKGIFRRVLRSGLPEMTLDVASDHDYMELIAATRAQMNVPLVSDGKTIGVLILETAHPEHFTPGTYETVRSLAARIAAAIGNAVLYEERNALVDDLNAFSETVAHDLRSPLGVIINYVQLAASEHKLTGQLALDYFQHIHATASKGVEIIDSLLTLAHVRSDETITAEPLEMKSIVNAAKDQLESELKAASAALTMPDDWPAAAGYRPWLEEVWVNYMNNAIKYGGQPPVVTLGWDQPADSRFIRFWVKDNGAGLAREEVDQLFRPFSRLSSAKAGHGLGLTIVRRIIERFGGTVGVESTPGKGSLFFFTLPSARPGSSR